MSDILNISDFLEPINRAMLSLDEDYKDGQFGKTIDVYEEAMPELELADIVLVGCGESRGAGINIHSTDSPDTIRAEFYQLFYWHTDVHIADVGNVKRGASLNDTYAALKTVVSALTAAGKLVVILGGTHDLTMAQYRVYADQEQIIEAACVDALIDLDIDSRQRDKNFLMEMLTGEPNFIRHYNHIGFQSYYVHPRMLETMDKLRFDCFRVGHIKEAIEEMEPVIRNAKLFSFDIAAIAHAFAPANGITPNGFNGEEACILMRYAGLSPNIDTVGIYGYMHEKDRDNLTAKQISHMLWYLIDGRSRGQREAKLEEKESFNEFTIAFAEIETVFLQSKRTGRWWMQLPDQQFIACSYKDYLLASSNEIPERWLRAQERS
ncbi:arginase family protein [Pseudoflavitalea rhizosphaerae]|uniref:arginase family protein n=1 Tax=Pseudoflavitalea rhizosphaerae TaxID=1884793 RepID=UPI000F8D291E|nr:arginase family protein [Pseudoflavitalea rhizosphaerae]